MKSTLAAFAALAALALPAGLPTLAQAQDEFTIEPDAAPPGPFVRVQAEAPQERRGSGDRSDGGDRDRGGRDGGWNPPTPPVEVAPAPAPPAPPAPPHDDRGRWDRDRGDRGHGSGGQDRGDRDHGDRDRNGQGWDRDRGNDGRWNRGGDNGHDWNRDRDQNRNGGWNGGGWNGNNGRDWNHDRNGGGRNWNHDRNGRRDYGGFNHRWNQNDWRRNWNRGRSSDWWHNDRSFRGFNGVRFGFYFAPNHGYYSVPRSYYGQRYYVGSYLPSIFWRYQLNDYRTYGLGYPPHGTQWVLVDTTIYLVDSFDGYIIDAIYNAWRW